MKKIITNSSRKLTKTNKYISWMIGMLLILVAGIQSVTAQNLTMKTYGTSSTLDVSVLDNIFGTVTVDGAVRTADYSGTTSIAALPSTVLSLSGVQVVLITDFNGFISNTQANVLIAYVKAGGILIGNFEGTEVGNGSGIYVNKYIGEALLCNTVTLSATASGVAGLNPINQYHPGNGALLLNNLAPTATTTGSYATISNVPSENIIFANTNNAACGSQAVLDMIVPAYPGCPSACGVNGFAILTGEVQGAMGATVGFRNNSQSNINYAQLMYDFLYDPTAMTTRRAWSTISTNNNTTCAPALAPCLPTCAAGTTAPTLSATTAANVCPATTVNLTTIIASNLPSGTTLTWHTATPATTANKIATPSAVAAGTYYAAFFDATNNCYSGTGGNGSATTVVTATTTTCAALTANNPSTQTVTGGQVYTGNAGTELAPTGGTGPYTYSNGSSDPACINPGGATALPPASNLTVTNSTTGAYTYTAPTASGTYFFCIKVCDSTSPTPSCVVKTYTVVVPCAAGSTPPVLIKN